jgi:DNA-binding MarR family transcriptional regulator
MNSSLQDSLVSLRRIIRATETSARELAKQADMATSELLTLQLVADNPGISPGDLAKSLSLSPVTSTVILQKLESRGLVKKIRCKADKRRLEVVLTEKGSYEVNDAPSSLQTRFTEGFSQLQDWEQHLIASVLARVTTLLGAELIDAAPILDIGELDKPVN